MFSPTVVVAIWALFTDFFHDYVWSLYVGVYHLLAVDEDDFFWFIPRLNMSSIPLSFESMAAMAVRFWRGALLQLKFISFVFLR
ncbi:hypothetical protein Hanom_Chr04g00305761 [Helianthus anomalus]